MTHPHLSFIEHHFQLLVVKYYKHQLVLIGKEISDAILEDE